MFHEDFLSSELERYSLRLKQIKDLVSSTPYNFCTSVSDVEVLYDFANKLGLMISVADSQASLYKREADFLRENAVPVEQK